MFVRWHNHCTVFNQDPVLFTKNLSSIINLSIRSCVREWSVEIMVLAKLQYFQLSLQWTRGWQNANMIQIWPPLISISLFLSDKPHHEKEHVKIGHMTMFRSCRTNTCKMAGILKTENKRWTNGSQVHVGWLPYILSHIFRFFKCSPFHLCLAYSSETWLNH